MCSSVFYRNTIDRVVRLQPNMPQHTLATQQQSVLVCSEQQGVRLNLSNGNQTERGCYNKLTNELIQTRWTPTQVISVTAAD